MSAARSIRQRWVQVYCTSWCASSRRVKNLLNKNEIPFEEIDIEKNLEAARQVEEWTGGYRSVPTLHVRMILTEPDLGDLDLILEASKAQLLECILYTTSWCPDCRRAKNWLSEHQISCQEIDIDQDEAAARQVEEWTGGYRSVPTLDLHLRVTEPTTDQLIALLGLEAS